MPTCAAPGNVLNFTPSCDYVLTDPPFLPLVISGLVFLLLIPLIFVQGCGLVKNGDISSISRTWREPVSIISCCIFVEHCIIFQAICVNSGALQGIFIALEICVLMIVAFNPNESEINTPRGYKYKIIHGVFATLMFTGIYVVSILVGVYEVFDPAGSVTNAEKSLYVVATTLAGLCLLYVISIAFGVFEWTGITDLAEYLVVFIPLLVIGVGVETGCVP
jgi:uncharacterized membrane protein